MQCVTKPRKQRSDLRKIKIGMFHSQDILFTSKLNMTLSDQRSPNFKNPDQIFSDKGMNSSKLGEVLTIL